jgi:hypothetical protein
MEAQLQCHFNDDPPHLNFNFSFQKDLICDSSLPSTNLCREKFGGTPCTTSREPPAPHPNNKKPGREGAIAEPTKGKGFVAKIRLVDISHVQINGQVQ